MQLDDLPLTHSFLELGNDFHSRVAQQPLRHAYFIHGNPRVAAQLGLHPSVFQHPSFVPCFNGTQPHPCFAPLAMVYAGHQFGSYVPQLGDGRAMLLGEVETPTGQWDLVTKGSGQTPYSRFADGRAVLRSSLREYLCSAAMTGLGIPTSQALCIIGSEEPVQRERIEPGALIVRVAQSHLRFGSFEYFSHTNQHDALRSLVDYTIQRHFPKLHTEQHPVAAFLAEVTRRTARLMARWQSVGFTHGVMNTDNMSIIGDTFDYGPFGFMDAFEPHHIPNHSDHTGRYAFDQQPGIGLWNCRALAYALHPLLPAEAAKEILDDYEPTYQTEFHRLIALKLGLNQNADHAQTLFGELAPLLALDRVDYTIFFRKLCSLNQNTEQVKTLFSSQTGIQSWLDRYTKIQGTEPGTQEDRGNRMRQVNPKFVLRNYLAETAIRQAEDYRDHSVIEKLMTVLASPFEEHHELESFAEHPPDWSKDLQLSCSS